MARGPEATVDLPIATERAGGVPTLAEIPIGASWPRNHHPTSATKANTSVAPTDDPLPPPHQEPKRHRRRAPLTKEIRHR
jgi:hypothetical protein